MDISAGNIVCIMVALGFVVFHTFLLTNLSEQLQTSLRRIDVLEELLQNATEEKSSKKTVVANSLEEIKMRLDTELGNVDGNVKVLRLLRRIKRLEKRVETCKENDNLSRGKRNVDSRRRYTRPPCGGEKSVVYTVWGGDKCHAKSKFVLKGQMMTTDGSDFVCFADRIPDRGILIRINATHGRGSGVNLRGVTYDDIEDAVSFDSKPAWGPKSRNNKTVPCALCARCGKSSSKMIVANPRDVRPFLAQREYTGVLMTTKESKKLICINIDAKSYNTSNMLRPISSKARPTNTVKLYPAVLRCNSMYCEAQGLYKDKNRVQCAVVTF